MRRSLLENGAESPLTVGRLRCLVLRERRHHQRREHQQQGFDLRRVEARRGLYAVLHGVGVLTEDAAKNSAATATQCTTQHATEASETAEHVGRRVTLDRALDRAL